MRTRGSVATAGPCRRRLAAITITAAMIIAAQTMSVHAAAQGLAPDSVAKIKDAVVLIDVTLSTPAGEMGGSGSGFVISPAGRIITNAHVVSMVTEDQFGGVVVADDRSVRVTFHPSTAQEQSYDAQVLREHHEIDLALLQIEQDTPVYLDLADSDAIPETSGIYACGHPLGLREISIRTGTVTAHRTWEGRRYVEHDASAEEGNSGGPVVMADTRVIGVHTMTLVSSGMLTKFAIPSNVLSAWLAAAPSDDPPPPIPGKAVRELLTASDLYFEEPEVGSFSIPYDNDVAVTAHQYEDFLRLYCELGELPGGNRLLQGYAALEALRFNYTDPVGRLSIWELPGGALMLYWECQVPMSLASGDYLKTIADAGANQAARWEAVLRAEEPGEPSDLYPGGTNEELATMTESLRQQIDGAGLQYDLADDNFKLPYDNDVTVYSRIYKGMVWTYSYTGGIPGATRAEQGQIAIELLKRNWDDPLGRLSLDSDYDLLWESQVPSEFLTPDYFAILGATAATQVADFTEQYGQIPFNG
ncbi:MAG: trypsin-like peptidase domain-containing protein [Armatimonadota bacterium]|jgi:S1-C subfamily serine protease